MKTTLFFLTILFCTQTFAAKCVVTGRVMDGMDCHWLSTRFEVSSEEDCKALAQATKESGFFQIMDEGEILLFTRYKFKDKKIKVKKTLTFDDSKSCN